MTDTARPPLFIVIEPSGAAARAPATRMSWACAEAADVAELASFKAACARLSDLVRGHAVYLADPLFDAPRFATLFAAAGLAAPEHPRDWLLALAPFGQARNFAAILEAAAARADPLNPATRLLEAWREARERSGA